MTKDLPDKIEILRFSRKLLAEAGYENGLTLVGLNYTTADSQTVLAGHLHGNKIDTETVRKTADVFLQPMGPMKDYILHLMPISIED
ncbi:MAG: hypothetical protein GY866_03175 [Proteobacteria bacterium]|nr:hypothetical protein [Pseudomonadota bacterium]